MKSNEAVAKFGTTGRGIGPAYEEKSPCRALKVADLFRADLPEKTRKLT